MSYIDDKTLLLVNNNENNIIFILFKNIYTVLTHIEII